MARRIPRASLDAWLRDVERLLEAHPVPTDTVAEQHRLAVSGHSGAGAGAGRGAVDEKAGQALRR